MGEKVNIYGDKSEHYDDGKRTPERKNLCSPHVKGAEKGIST